MAFHGTRERTKENRPFFQRYAGKALFTLKNLPRAKKLLKRRMGTYFAMRELGKFVDVDAMYRSIDGEAIPPEWNDLFNIYRMVREAKPYFVVEFGSGCSTPLIAHALRVNHEKHGVEAKFTSFERDSRWLSVSKGMIQKEDAAFCDLRFIETDTGQLSIYNESLHPALPREPKPDFVYFDDSASNERLNPGVGFENIADHVASDAIFLIDGRRKLVDEMIEKIKVPMVINRNELHHYTVIELRNVDAPSRLETTFARHTLSQ